MNFTCPQCQRRYTLADEKVRGKTVRVRCKACQSVVTVQGPPEQAPEEEGATRVFSHEDMARLRAAERAMAAPSPAAPAPAAAPAPVAALWFAMLQGKQVGPLSEVELRGQVQAGTLTARTYFWREGMAEWAKGADVPELARLFPAVAPVAPALPPVVPAPAPAPARPAALGGLFDAPVPAPAQPAAPGWSPGAVGPGAPAPKSPSGDTTLLLRRLSGVHRRLSAGRVVAVLVAAPLVVLAALVAAGVVPLTVQRVDAAGRRQEVSIFTAEGVEGLVDQVLGRTPEPTPAPQAAPAAPAARPARATPAKGSKKRGAQAAPAGGQVSGPERREKER